MNEYYHPMDRGYNAAHDSGVGHGDGCGHNHGSSFGIGKSTGDLGIGIGDLGFSFSLGPVPNVQAIAAKIRPGAKRIELAFTGTGKGTGQGQTPEYYGKKQRQALREVSQANRVDFSTHSTIGIAGLAGMDQQGSFSKASKNFSTQEVKRAIEFAGDVSGGGPVVVHTGEFQRPISDADWNQEGEHKGKFKMFSDEEQRASFRVIDTRTGAVVQEARKNKKVARPVWNTVKDGMEYMDFDGTMKTASGSEDSTGKPIYLDYFGNRLQPEKRVPEYNDETGTFKVHYLEWDDLKKEAKEMSNRAKEVWKDWKSGKISKEEFEESYWVRFKDANNVNEINVRPEEAFIISTLETNAANSRGWGYYYGAGFKDSVDTINKLEKAKKMWEEIEETTDEEEKWQLKQVFSNRYGNLIPPEAKFPTEQISELLLETRGRLMQAQESSASQFAQAEEAKDQIRHIESADTYAFNEALDSYADLGISAMRQTDKTKKEGRYVKPIAVAMENLFPEQYGAHPEELIKLVKGSRRTMERKLMQLGVSSEEAKKKAKDHITSTFDTGHLNTWRKYWNGDPKKTIEQNDKDFDKWSLDMVRKMVKEGVVGHVHLDDNYGYHDDHLAPGEGNTPIREMVKILKEEGYDGEMIVEPGADFTTDASGFHSVLKTWRHFGIPVYGSGAGAVPGSRTWNEVGYGWFGQQAPPYFTFGGYSPSEDWTLWSGVQLE